MDHPIEQNAAPKRELHQSITLHQLEVFAATCRNSSFSRAADEFSLTQPTISMQVKHLSHVIGSPLLETIGKQIYPTETGEKVFKASQAIFERLDQLQSALNELKGINQGKLRLASSRTAKYVIPRLLPSFYQAYPDIEISLRLTSRQNVLQRLEDHQDDLYILSYPPESDLVEARAFLSNPLVVIAPIDHPLAQEKSIPLQSLKGDNWVLREPGSATRMATDRLFQKHGFCSRIRMELNSNEAIKQAVIAGIGLSVVSLHSLRSVQSTSTLACLDVEGFPLYQQWYAVLRKDKFLPTTAKLFLEHLLQRSQSECQFSPDVLLQLSGDRLFP